MLAGVQFQKSLPQHVFTCQALCNTTATPLSLGSSLCKRHSGWLLAGTVAGQGLKDGLCYSLGIGLRDTCRAARTTAANGSALVEGATSEMYASRAGKVQANPFSNLQQRNCF
jgi:hypothetical protein